MIAVGVNYFIENPAYYVDWALNGEKIKILSRTGKTLILELKENNDGCSKKKEM